MMTQSIPGFFSPEVSTLIIEDTDLPLGLGCSRRANHVDLDPYDSELSANWESDFCGDFQRLDLVDLMACFHGL